jgi:hypothetical protein
MRTQRVYSNQEYHPGYGAGDGDTERYEYLCPCGKGRIIEEHDNIPGFREHDAWLRCSECSKKYRLDTFGGVRGWQLVELNGK